MVRKPSYEELEYQVKLKTSELEKAKNKMKDLEKKYIALMSEDQKGHLKIDGKGILIFVDRDFSEMLGYKNPEDMLGKHFTEFIQSDAKESILQRFKKIMQEGHFSEFIDIPAIKKDGTPIMIRLNDFPILENGRSVGVKYIIRSITDQQHVEKEFQEKNELLQSILDNAPLIILVRDPDGRYLLVNSRYEELTGPYAETTLGKTPIDLNGIEIGEKILRSDRQVLQSGKTVQTEKQIIINNEEYTFLSIRAPLIDSNNRPFAVCVMDMDITDQKKIEQALCESENRYRRITESITDYIYTVYIRNGEPEKTIHSSACALVTGYDTNEFESDPSLWMKLIHEEDHPMVQEQFNCMLQKQELNPIEHRIIKKDGQVCWVKNISVPHYDSHGNLTFYDTFIRDITERKFAEDEKKKLQSQLQQAQKMEAIGTLAGGIAHDFNNILSIIVGNAELAFFDMPQDAPLRQNLERIFIASMRARDLIKQILTFSRQDEKKLVPYDIRPVVKESTRLLRAFIPSNIEIRQSISDEIGTIKTDPTQINQILINLCANAAYAIGANGGEITIRLQDIELDSETDALFSELRPGKHIKLTIKDNGHGIALKIMDKIFDPYFTTKKKGDGTGMGLAVVHGIIKNHGGEITVSSVLSKGTSFHIYIPCVEDDAIKEHKNSTKEVLSGSERILFVDDEEAVVQFSKQILERVGYKVTTTTDSRHALAIFRDNPDDFDLLITDQTMPKIIGVNLAKKAMEIRSDIPIILVSGHSKAVNEEQVKAVGIRAFIMKPFNVGEFCRVIRSVLDEDLKNS